MSIKYKLLYWLALPGIFRRINRRNVAVLMYHGVLPDDDPLAEGDWLQVRVSEFRRQMVFLQRHYEVIHFADVLHGEGGGAAPGRPRAIITFDDGYANNFRWALPILQEFGLPATVFTTTAFLDTQRIFWWDNLRLSLARAGRDVPGEWVAALKSLHPGVIDAVLARRLAAEGIEACHSAPESYRSLNCCELRAMLESGLIRIGSHTHRHEILQHLTDHELKATLDASIRTLTDMGVKTTLFAAPNGSYSDAQNGAIRECGFEICAATHPALWHCPEDCYRVPRLPVGRGTSEEQFAVLLSGCLEFLKKLTSSRKRQSTY